MTHAVFSRDDLTIELPQVPASQGNNGYDISKLMAATGDTTIDVGFANTASCQSKITFIDGDAGILRYRGYPIEKLAETSTFLEVSYLVLHGELPTAAQLDAFGRNIAKYHIIDERMREMFRCWPTAMVSPNQPMLLTLAKMVGASVGSMKRCASSAPNRSS